MREGWEQRRLPCDPNTVSLSSGEGSSDPGVCTASNISCPSSLVLGSSHRRRLDCRGRSWSSAKSVALTNTGDEIQQGSAAPVRISQRHHCATMKRAKETLLQCRQPGTIQGVERKRVCLLCP